MSNAEQILGHLLRKIAAERSLSNPQIKTKSISSGGANYTTQLFLATISDGDTELKLFAKVAAIGEKFRERMPMEMFKTENWYYTELTKVYEELQDKHNIPENKRFVRPEFYGCSEKRYEEAVVLENLSENNYKVYNRLISVDWPYASRAVEELAKFHALSIALMTENREKFDEILINHSPKFGNKNDALFENIIQKALEAIKEEYRPRVKAYIETFDVMNFDELSEPLKLTVLSHGDYRVSNQMYKVDTDGRIHLKVVDYQTIRAAPPVLDLLYFIFSGTDEKFRAQYYDKLLDHYYSELCEAMRRFSIDPEEVYSRADFYEEYRAKLPFGLTVAMFSLPIVTVDVENAPVVDDDMDIAKITEINSSALFPERINGIINDFIRWGVL